MADNDVTVRFGADIGQLQAAVQALQAALAGVSKSVGRVAADLGSLGAAAAPAVAAQTDAADKTRKAWDKAVTPIARKFADGLVQMAEGAKSFSQVMASISREILDTWARNIATMVAKWAVGVAQHVASEQGGQAAIAAAHADGAAQATAIDGAAALKQIVNSAAAAAAGAYEAMAGIPVVGPVLGAAAAAAAFGAVLAFQGMVASAAGGYDIPAGVNPMTQLHAQEMVLPAHLANPMRSLLSGYSAGGAGAGAGGETHLHYAPTINAPANASLRQMLVDQGSDMIAFVQGAMRDGSLRLA